MKYDTFHCPMCFRDLPRVGRSFIIGWPGRRFLICRDCLKWVVKQRLPANYKIKVVRWSKIDDDGEKFLEDLMKQTD